MKTDSAFFWYATDMYNIAVKWTEYAPRALDVQPDIFAGTFDHVDPSLQFFSHLLNLL